MSPMNSPVRRIIADSRCESRDDRGKIIMKILITTPGGTIGRRIVPELLAPEFSVRVISRNPDQLEFREHVEIARGSTDNVAALSRALDGVDALFWCIPRLSIRETSPRDYYERFARAASHAIREAGTLRVVSVSAGSILES